MSVNKDKMLEAIKEEFGIKSYAEEAVINVNNRLKPPAAPPAPPPATSPPQFTYYPNARDLEADFKEAADDPDDDYEECTLKHVEKEYRAHANDDLNSIKEYAHYWKASRVAEILRLRTVTRIRPVKLDLDKFTVEIGHQSITFTLIFPKHDNHPTIEFINSEGGCNIRAKNVNLVKHVNYQQLAASSFVYIIRSNEQKFKEIKFSIEQTKDENPLIFPFQTFLSSIDMYLEMQNVKIEATEFSLGSNRNYASKYFARSFIQTIIPHFIPKVLESISIQLKETTPEARDDKFIYGNERDISVVRRIFGTEQWKQATEVCIDGEILDEEDYSEFCHFTTVKMPFPRQNREETEKQFRNIMKSFQKLKSYDKLHECTYEVLKNHFNIGSMDGWTFGKTDTGEEKLSTVLSNGVKLDLQEKEVIFTIIPKQLKLVEKAKKSKNHQPTSIESVVRHLWTILHNKEQ